MSRRVNENGEPIVDTAIEEGESVMATIDDAWVAIKILQELIVTPCMRSLHFEFDIEVGEVPTVRYTIERNAVWETFNEKGE